MQVLLIYDIENDKARTKIATACQDYGLDRVQFSAFAGRLSRNYQQELMLKIDALLKNAEGRRQVSLIPICEKDWQSRLEVGDA
ncbi:MAG: CRISPR-associated endonuclease Cas2 [Chloroflexi bacterium]|nr:CRISPR-associated endonuclease Cas2 [Chloroflexota bacterium]